MRNYSHGILSKALYLKLVKCVKQVPNGDKLEIPYSVYVSSRFEYFAQNSARIVLVP